MKKIIYSAILAFAGLFATSCVQEHIDAIYDPSQATASVLSIIQGCSLDEDGSAITASFDPAVLGQGLATTYSFFVSPEADMASATKLNATISVDEGNGTVSFTQKELNNYILNNGGEGDVEMPLYFQLVSYLMNDKGNGIESTAIKSNIVASSFIPYSADLRDCDKYPVAYLPGGYQAKGAGKSGWVFDDEQYLYDYDGSGVYTGLLDVYEVGAAGLDYGFKLTLANTWDNGDYGAPKGADLGSEPASIELAAKPEAADNDNILCFDSHRFYMFSFDPKAKTLTKSLAFDSMAICGDFNDWKPEDPNAEMSYNKYYHRFYIDYTFATDAKLKFAVDDTWDIANWGVDMERGGADIAVPAGSYRVYIDLNKNSYEFSTKMFGQEEPGAGNGGGDTPDEPTKYEGWGIIGVGGDWEKDITMTESDGVWTGYTNIAAADGFKLRKDGAWTENRGAEGDVEPYVITAGTSFSVVNNGKNLAVPADGFYQIVYNSNDETITISNGDVWSVIGQFNSWSGDTFMTLTDGKWVSPAITLVANEGFKVRYNAGWDVNRGAEGDVEPFVVTLGESFTAVAGGKNLAVAEDGDYIITYDAAAETITVDAALPKDCWSVIGQVNGSNWNKDFYMTENDGVWMSEKLSINAGDGFKVRFNNDWGVNRGATGDSEPYSIGVGDAVEVVGNGKNLTVKESGSYVIVYDTKNEKMFLLGWSVIGQVNGSSWDKDIVMTPSEDGLWTSEVFTVEGGFKVRYGASWDDNRGAEGDTEPYVMASCVSTKAVANGKNLGVNTEDGKYWKLVYDSKNGTLTAHNCSWSVIGQVNGASWDKDVVMCEETAGNFVSAPFTVEGGFKIRFNRGWDVNRGAAGDVEPYNLTIGTAISGVQNGKNLGIESASGQYVLTFNASAQEITVNSVK